MSDHATTGHDAVLHAHGYHSLRVKEVVDETDDTRSFVLDVPTDLRHSFAYRAGQFCTFRVRIGSDELLRSYSMSTAPGVDDDFAVTVKRVPSGAVSNWFNDRVSVGDVLELSRPAGVFCPRPGEVPVVALCGGSGVTPVFSIIKDVLATTTRPIELLYANRSADSVIFDAELRRLQGEHGDRLRVQLHFDSDAGYLDGDAVHGFVADHLDGDFYICGPTPFMDLVETTLLAAGVVPERIFIERFQTGGPPLPLEPDGVPPDAADENEATEEVVVILRGKPTTVTYRAGDTILETARRGGLAPPFSCEAGNCATCMAFLREGTVTMRVNNALTPDEIEEGWILTCQGLPTSRTVTVEYESF